VRINVSKFDCSTVVHQWIQSRKCCPIWQSPFLDVYSHSHSLKQSQHSQSQHSQHSNPPADNTPYRTHSVVAYSWAKHWPPCLSYRRGFDLIASILSIIYFKPYPLAFFTASNFRFVFRAWVNISFNSHS